MNGHPASLSENLRPGDSVLLLCPSMVADEDGACTHLLTLDDPERKRVLCVCLSHSLDRRCAVWNRTVGVRPADAAVVVPSQLSMSLAGRESGANGSEWVRSDADGASGADTRGGSTAPDLEGDGGDDYVFDPSVEHVGSPGDTTTLGVRITERVDAWDAEPSDHQTVICFDSVSTLLQYTDFQVAYKFLDALANYVEDVGAIAHFHLDPGAHDEQTVTGLVRLFDSVYAYEDGDWTLRQ